MASQFVFSAESPARGRELWVTDGTPGGTQLLADISPGPDSSNLGSIYYPGEGGTIPNPADLVPFGDGSVLFDANDGTNGAEPWITNGTPEGTHLLADVNPGADNGTAPSGAYSSPLSPALSH